jgi:hypothetical protein
MIFPALRNTACSPSPRNIIEQRSQAHSQIERLELEVGRALRRPLVADRPHPFSVGAFATAVRTATNAPAKRRSEHAGPSLAGPVQCTRLFRRGLRPGLRLYGDLQQLALGGLWHDQRHPESLRTRNGRNGNAAGRRRWFTLTTKRPLDIPTNEKKYVALTVPIGRNPRILYNQSAAILVGSTYPIILR